MMTQFEVKFHVDKKYLGDVLESLHPFRIDALEHRLLVTPGHKGKAGGVPAWQAAVNMATTKSMPRAHYKQKLVAAGYAPKAVDSGLDQATRKKALIKSKTNGIVMFRAGLGGSK